TVWLTRCDCGSPLKPISTMRLTRNTKPTRSCGCVLRKPIGESAKARILRDYKHNSKRRSIIWKLSDARFSDLIQSECHYCGGLPSGNCHPSDANGSFT